MCLKSVHDFEHYLLLGIVVLLQQMQIDAENTWIMNMQGYVQLCMRIGKIQSTSIPN